VLGIPDHETPHAVIAIGWPDETYRRVASANRSCRYVRPNNAHS
jgi:hypothetical protein